MPTAAKLVAAIMFAVVSWFAAEVFKGALPEGMSAGLLSPVMAAFGAGSGWLVMGPLAGRGYGAAAGSAFRTSFTIVFLGVLLFALYEMIRRSTNLRYDGPVEAIQGMMELMWEYGAMLMRPDVLAVMFGGGIVAGYVTEWAARRWP